MAVVARKFDFFFLAGLCRQALDFHQRFFRHQSAHFVRQPLNRVLGFRLRQAMTVSRDHADRIRLQDQKCAVQCVPRFFGRDGEVRLGDQRRQYRRGQLCQRVRERWDGREVAFLHADHFVGFAIGDDLHPVIFKQFEAQLALGQQTHQLQQFLGGNRSRALAFDFGFATRSDRKLEVGRGQRQAVALRFKKEI